MAFQALEQDVERLGDIGDTPQTVMTTKAPAVLKILPFLSSWMVNF